MTEEKRRCVVIADGHQNVLETIRNLLVSVFGTVIMVADRQSLFEALERIMPDLAIVDLSLPPVEKESIAYEIKDYFPELKYIILSVHDEPEVIRVDSARGWPKNLVVANNKLHLVALVEPEFVENLMVPITRPALVHYFGFNLRDEILRFLIDDVKKVALPFRKKWVIGSYKLEEVRIRFKRVF